MPADPPEPRSPRFSRGRSVLYATVIVLAFFGALEGVLRIVGVHPPVRPRILLRTIDVDIDLPFMRADRELFWFPRPGFRGEFLGKPVTINALGLRGPEVALPKPPGRRRVVCFGDSITFGYGVADEETYPFLLGRHLADHGVEAVNAGVTGYTSHQVVRLLRRLAPTVEADVATFCVGWNDGNRRPVDDREYERRLGVSLAVDGVLDRLYIYRAMKGLYVRALWRDPPASAGGTRVAPAQYRENLEAVVHECRARGIRPVFIALPHRRREGEPPYESPYPAVLAETARDLGVPLLDAGPLGLATPLASNETYFIDTLHLSVAGHELLGDELARQLVALGLL